MQAQNKFKKRILLNGEWVDSFRTLSELNSRHAPLYRSSNESKIVKTKSKKRGGNLRRHGQTDKIVIPIHRSFSDNIFHADNFQRSLSDDSMYSGLPLRSPFRTVTEMFDVASISRHKNFYFTDNVDGT